MGKGATALRPARARRRSPEGGDPLARGRAGVRPSGAGKRRAARSAENFGQPAVAQALWPGERGQPAGLRPEVAKSEIRNPKAASAPAAAPAGNIGCRTRGELGPVRIQKSWPAAWAFAGFGVAVGGVNEGLAALVAVGPATSGGVPADAALSVAGRVLAAVGGFAQQGGG